LRHHADPRMPGGFRKDMLHLGVDVAIVDKFIVNRINILLRGDYIEI
jgi:hypothetical protein